MTTESCEIIEVSVVPEPPGDEPCGDSGAQRASGYHRWMLTVALGILVVSFLFGNLSEGRVTVPFLGVPMPGLCAWKVSMGLDCPGCGMTRCFISMAYGNWREAFHFHAVGVVLFVAVVAQLPYRGIQLWRLARGKNELKHRVLDVLPWLLLAGLLGQWLVKMAGLLLF